MIPKATVIRLDRKTRSELEGWLRASTTEQRMVRWAGGRRAAQKDTARPAAKPIYTEATGKRILAVLDQPVPKGRARWTCELIADALGDVDVNYVRRFLRKQKIDLAGRKSWCE